MKNCKGKKKKSKKIYVGKEEELSFAEGIGGVEELKSMDEVKDCFSEEEEDYKNIVKRVILF